MDIFDPAHYGGVRRPVGEAETLPAWCYTSPEFYAREVERIFTPGWHFVARTDELPEPGSYLAVDTAPGPLLLLRDGAGRVGVFANTCRHRGARLLDSHGRCRTIVCPYHAWTYGPDGSLLGAPGMQDRPGFDRAAWGLTPVRSESWQGFLFVRFSDRGPGLVEHFGDLAEKLGSYAFDQMVCVRRRDYDVACNWKLLVENAMEEYHTGTVHHASLGQQYAVQGRHPHPAGDEHRRPAWRDGAVPAGARSHRPGRARGVLHDAPPCDPVRVHAGLHVVAADRPARPNALAPRRRLLLPADHGGADGLRGRPEEVHAPMGNGHRGGQRHLRGPAGRAHLHPETVRPVLAPRAGGPPRQQLGAGPGPRRPGAPARGARPVTRRPVPEAQALVAAALEEGREEMLKRVC